MGLTLQNRNRKRMKIITEQNILGIEKDHRWAEQFTVFRYKDGATSTIPKGFFRNWLDQDKTLVVPTLAHSTLVEALVQALAVLSNTMAIAKVCAWVVMLQVDCA